MTIKKTIKLTSIPVGGGTVSVDATASAAEGDPDPTNNASSDDVEATAAPAAGEAVTAQAGGGSGERPSPRHRAFVPLGTGQSIPNGSEVDASKGQVVVTSATPSGGLQTVDGRGRQVSDHAAEVERADDAAALGSLPKCGSGRGIEDPAPPAHRCEREVPNRRCARLRNREEPQGELGDRRPLRPRPPFARNRREGAEAKAPDVRRSPRDRRTRAGTRRRTLHDPAGRKLKGNCIPRLDKDVRKPCHRSNDGGNGRRHPRRAVGERGAYGRHRRATLPRRRGLGRRGVRRALPRRRREPLRPSGRGRLGAGPLPAERQRARARPRREEPVPGRRRRRPPSRLAVRRRGARRGASSTAISATIFDADYPPTSLHRLLARLPALLRERGAAAAARAHDELRRPASSARSTSRASPTTSSGTRRSADAWRGSFIHRAPGGEAGRGSSGRTSTTGLAPDERPVDPQAPRRDRPERPERRQLRHHRGQLHRLPLGRRHRRADPDHAPRADDRQPLPLPRLLACATGTCA